MSKLQLLDKHKKVLFSVDLSLPSLPDWDEFNKKVEDLVCRIKKLLIGERLEITKCGESFEIKNKAIRILWILAELPQLYSESTESEYFIHYIRFVNDCNIKVFQLD